MINSVNSFNPVQNVNQAQYNNSGVSIQNQTPQPVANATLNGSEALGNYNKPQQPVVIEPLHPTIPNSLEEIGGELIKSPSGKLNSIVKRGINHTLVYKMEPGTEEDTIGSIHFFDNKTGKLAAVQVNHNFYDKNSLSKNPKYIMIEHYDPQTGSVDKRTVYNKGKLENVSTYEYGNGYKKTTSISGDNKASITEFLPDGSTKHTSFNKDGKINFIEKLDVEHNKETVIYRNGVPSEIKTSKAETLPNTTGRNPLEDKDLKPAQPYVLGYDPKTVQGEKQYYSNNDLERITTQTKDGEVIHLFSPGGNLAAIKTPDKTIIYNNLADIADYSVEEYIGDDVTKTTSFNLKNNEMTVSVMDNKNDITKIAHYEDGKMIYYNESNDKTHENLGMEFTKSGRLICAETEQM